MGVDVDVVVVVVLEVVLGVGIEVVVVVTVGNCVKGGGFAGGEGGGESSRAITGGCTARGGVGRGSSGVVGVLMGAAGELTDELSFCPVEC